MTILDLKDKLYTSTEVANILGVSLRSVYRYLEEDKLTADVKTATGRHRFSRQNIMDFLYPTKSNDIKESANTSRNEKSSDNISDTVNRDTVQAKHTKDAVENNTSDDEVKISSKDVSETKEDVEVSHVTKSDVDIDNVVTDEDTEPVDWLARFRAAAEKYRNEQAATSSSQTIDTNTQETEQTTSTDTIDSFIPKYEEVVVDEKSEYYYLSGIGGLKDIAQGIDKAAKKASVDYAFTMDAGLSLFKPIRPFSLIHAYVRPQDRDFFEKSLKLTEVSKNSAQLCLIVSDDRDLYSSKSEMYGLSVVSKERLKLDLISNGEKDLVSELDTIA